MKIKVHQEGYDPRQAQQLVSVVGLTIGMMITTAPPSSVVGSRRSNKMK